MSALLRVEMIVLALVFITIVFVTVNKRSLQMRYSLIWLLISFAMIVIAFFPQLIMWLSDVVQIQTPSNFLYLLAVFALLMIAFSHTVNLSKQSEKIKRLTQMVSIEKYLQEEKSVQLQEESK